MISDNYIRKKIQRQYETDPNIHLTASLPRFPLKLVDAEARIVGVYAHIFGVEVVHDGMERRYFFQYGELITNNVIVEELNLH